MFFKYICVWSCWSVYWNWPLWLRRWWRTAETPVRWRWLRWPTAAAALSPEPSPLWAPLVSATLQHQHPLLCFTFSLRLQTRESIVISQKSRFRVFVGSFHLGHEPKQFICMSVASPSVRSTEPVLAKFTSNLQF